MTSSIFVPRNDKTSISSEALLKEIEDAITAVACTLENSKEVKKEFHTKWKALLEAYQKDIDHLDQQLESLPSSHDEYLRGEKNRKERCQRGGKSIIKTTNHSGKSENNTNSTHHALNFHLSTEKNGIDDLFILPPEEIDETNQKKNADSQCDDDSITIDVNSTVSSLTRRKREQRRVTKDRNEEIQERLDSRVLFFQHIDHMRGKEEILEKQLNAKDDNNESQLTQMERKNLTDELERCKAHNCELVVNMITSYKPRVPFSNNGCIKEKRQRIPNSLRGATFDPSSSKDSNITSYDKKLKFLGLNLPKVDDFLHDINQSVIKGTNCNTNNTFHDKASLPRILMFDKNQSLKDKQNDNLLRRDVSNTCETKHSNRHGCVPFQQADKQLSDILSDKQHFTSIHNIQVNSSLKDRSQMCEILQKNTVDIESYQTSSIRQDMTMTRHTSSSETNEIDDNYIRDPSRQKFQPDSSSYISEESYSDCSDSLNEDDDENYSEGFSEESSES